ncbi:hypothetical protein MKX03_025848 [Papaver bracteatum]|nr:hypothetical protein MKX03_025848 [Papaver bracteatum]
MLDGTQVQLKSVSLNKYVTAQDGGGQSVSVDREVPSSWETFRVDLFFYREPEETKDQEDDESGAPVAEYGVTECGVGMIDNDNWGADTQWSGDAISAPALAGGAKLDTNAGVPVEGEVSWEPNTHVKYW